MMIIMKNKINKIAVSFLVLLILGSGCTKNDYDIINTNPNYPSIDEASPDMLLTQAIERLTDIIVWVYSNHDWGNCWIQHMSRVQYTDEDRYIPRISTINGIWFTIYARCGTDLKAINKIALSTQNTAYEAVVLILQAYGYSVLSDLFGAIPYTDALKGADEEPNLSPSYDTQEFVYDAIIADLTKANTLLANTTGSIDGDILYNNDLSLWRKFANSLKLRLLMRISDRKNPTSTMTAMLAAPDTYPIFESNSEQASLQYLGSPPNNNPIANYYRTRDDHRVSKTLIDIMYNTGNPEDDYRVHAYAELAAESGDFVGLPNGMLSSDAAAYLGNGLAQTSLIGDFFREDSSPGTLMSYAELLFILAEAAQKGYIPGGDTKAEEYYVDGITASYYYYGETMVENFASNYGVNPEVYTLEVLLDWFLTDAGWVYDPAKALEQIATQKWVAMFDQGLQAWFEWRRLNFPVLTPAVSGAINSVPVRLYYPSDEYSTNSENVLNAVSLQGEDRLTTRVWWDVSDNY